MTAHLETAPSTRRYPRPQLRRDAWNSLDGRWRFCFDDAGRFRQPADVDWPLEITVPFAPESRASGIADTGFHPVCWYEREFTARRPADGGRVMLHFGAVDYAARVWVNGAFLGGHEGGHTPFAFDITEVLTAEGPQSVTVRAEDDPHDLAKPRGKTSGDGHYLFALEHPMVGLWRNTIVIRHGEQDYLLPLMLTVLPQ